MATVYLVAMWAVIQVAVSTFPALLLPHWSVTLVICLAIAGFPLVLVGAWAFELTPEGVRRTGETGEDGHGESAPALSRTAHAVLTVSGTVLVGLVVWAAWAMWVRGTATSEAAAADAPPHLDPSRIAVLYLDDYSKNHELGYLADGLTETLIHELSDVSGLSVVSRNGVRPYRDRDVPPDSIGKALGAGTIVEGSVQRSADRLRVTVQLVDAASGTPLESKQIEKRPGELFALQDDVAAEVARFLRRRLGKEIELRRAREGATDWQAWKLYRVAMRMRDDADSLSWARDSAGAADRYARVDSLLDEATRRDPAWTRPVIERGWTDLSWARLGTNDVTKTDSSLLRRGIEAANRVLSKAPGDPAALELRGNLEWFLSQLPGTPRTAGTLPAAKRDLQSATVLDPGRARAWAKLAYIFEEEGKLEEARLAARRLAEADPYLISDRDHAYVLITLEQQLHNLDDAERAAKRAEELYPTQLAYPVLRLQILASRPPGKSDPKQAWALLRRCEELQKASFPPGRFYVSAVLARAGLRDSARAVERRTREAGPTDAFSLYADAYASLQLGDRDRAIALLERFARQFPQQRASLARDWFFTDLRGDPRFEALVDTAGRDLP